MKDVFLYGNSLKPRQLCSEVRRRRRRVRRARNGEFNINSSTKEAAQPSSSKVTKSQWGKVISKISSLPPGICITEEKKKSLSYLLSVFPFPFGGVYCNEKRNEGRLFLTECFVNTVDFTGRADICGSWRGEEKMSLINQKQNDQWPVSAAMRNRGCEQHSNSLLVIFKWGQAHSEAGSDSDVRPPDCDEKWSMLAAHITHI